MKHFLVPFAFLAASALAFVPAARGEDLDAATLEALEKTQAMLRDPELRKGENAKDPQAVKTQESVKSFAGDAKNEQKMYEMSADIFGDLVRKTGGNADRLKAATKDAGKDPAAFYDSLSPEQKKRIHDLSIEIEKSNPSVRQPATQAP